MANHRYWRAYCREGGASSRTLCAEMTMAQSSGGADVTSTAFAIASGETGASESKDKAFDNNTAAYWQVIQTTGAWIGQDFGAGNEKDIVEISMQPLSGFATRMFRQFDVQYSDDNVTWTTAWSCSFTAWTNAAQTFTKPSAVADRYWRLRQSALVSGLVMGCAELELRESVGGADATGSGTGIGDQLTNIANAFDNNTATVWSGVSAADDSGYLGYDFGSGVTKTIVQVSFTARNDVNYFQSPTAGWIESGSNGIDFIERWTFSGLSWTQGSTNVFTDGAVAGSSRRRMVTSW